jgi:hypothetical protein
METKSRNNPGETNQQDCFHIIYIYKNVLKKEYENFKNFFCFNVGTNDRFFSPQYLVWAGKKECIV